MEIKKENATIDKNPVTTSQALNLLWEEWRYRHEVFWNSLYRWGTAMVAVTIAPYLLPDLIEKLGLAVMVFPFLASLLAIFAAWHLSSEYVRLIPVAKKYRQLLGEHGPDKVPDDTIVYQLLRLSIGKVVAIVFLGFAIIVEFLNSLVLMWLLIQK